MKVLLVHNYYQQSGGEDTEFAAEKALLCQREHEVVEFVRHNEEIHKTSRLRAATGTVWSRHSQHALQQLLRATHPDVVHFHNTFLRISPAAYYACREEGIPVVQTLQNYRLLCPGAAFLRDGRVCEDCMDKAIPWPGVLHGCWRDSRIQTGVVVAMLSFHRLLGTWHKLVDVYVALTEFARRKYIEGGLPAERIAIKPNFSYPDPGPRDSSGNYALFVGRISREKGFRTLVHAWRELEGVPLKVAGDGPLMEKAPRGGSRGLEMLGWCSHDEVLALMKNARFLVFPSEWYEGFPLTIAESFACGVPVVASRMGAMAEIVEDGRTGLHFEPKNPEDLAAKVAWAWSHPNEMQRMGHQARIEYERKYTAEQNYAALMTIYDKARRREKGKAE
jgi:glycosyltransferase involved in cell wall biosynthesis